MKTAEFSPNFANFYEPDRKNNLKGAIPAEVAWRTRKGTAASVYARLAKNASRSADCF
jgi:hypothetical protein